MKIHPLLALLLGSGWVGLTAGLPAEQSLAAFEKGAGETLGGVGIVIALGAMLGRLLADSGAADELGSAILERTGPRGIPWAMAFAAVLIGIPIFFEVGVVLLMPVILLFTRRAGGSVLRVGIPALAGLSVLHGLIPPHPGPLIATSILHADLGQTLVYGLVVAIPTAIIAGPVFGGLVAARLNLPPPTALAADFECAGKADSPPRLGVTVATLLLPVALMLTRTFVDFNRTEGFARTAGDFFGQPIVAMLVSVLVAMFTFGYLRGSSLQKVGTLLSESLAPIAAIVLIIGAGGGFKQTLVSIGIGNAIGKAAQSSHLPPLLLAWLIAAAIRVATGSATLATITASGLMAPLVPTFHDVSLPLLALSIGAGSLFLSHVNDAGFWLVKEYFGLTVGETLKSWSAMETIISVVAMAGIFGLNAIVPR